MREILFRGKKVRGGEWSYGVPVRGKVKGLTGGITLMISLAGFDAHYHLIPNIEGDWVIPETVGQFTGLYDSRGNKVFEGDVVQYQDESEFDIQAVVCFGEYQQDGSAGEYNPSDCVGWYIKVDNYTRPDWAEVANIHLPDYEFENSLSKKVSKCIVIGNVHDNPELVKEKTK